MSTDWIRAAIGALAILSLAGPATAEPYFLITGIDARLYPGSERFVPINPGPGFPGSFFDGDRLAGTNDAGPAVAYVGTPPMPLFSPNEFGAASFLFRRGSVPLGPPGQLPFMGIEFLGGPLLDLDGELGNGTRSLIPVTGANPVAIPDSDSAIDLIPDYEHQQIVLTGLDVTGTNEGAPGTGPAVATVLVTLAGTSPDGTVGAAINPAIDTRTGTLTPFTGTGSLAGVYRIDGLGFEFWEDTLLNSPSTGPLLGTLQYLGALSGWLVERQADGNWPELAGQGLGSTQWPDVDISRVGHSVNTANGAAGGSATIAPGIGNDTFGVAGNGGLGLNDFGGDLGVYLDQVILAHVGGDLDRVVYLESAGFGVNNSFDPVFSDTIGYDVVLIAAHRDACAGHAACDANCDGAVTVSDIGPFVLALTQGQAAFEQQFPGCPFLCGNDANGDGAVTVSDIGVFVQCVIR